MVALFVKFPAIEYVELAVSFQIAPVFKEMSPVNVFAPVLARANVPPIVVVPVTPKVKVVAVGIVRVVPDPIDKFPAIVVLATVVAVAVPLKVKLPPIAEDITIKKAIGINIRPVFVASKPK